MKRQGTLKDDKKTVKAETTGTPQKPLSWKEVEKQIRSGKVTEEQAFEWWQRYMDSLEYNEGQQFVTCCGGIQPLPILPPPDEGE